MVRTVADVAVSEGAQSLIHIDRCLPIELFETKTGRWWLPINALPGDQVVNEIRKGLVHDAAVVETARKHIISGSTVLDVGSSYGQMAVLFAAMVGPQGIVHAFEADPFSCWLLSRNLKENEAVNVVVHSGAVWDRAGQTLAYPEPDFKRFESFGSYGIVPGASGPRTVQSLTIDDLEIPPRVSFIKVDVQGSDLFALRGARRIIERDQPAVIFEFEGLFQEEFGTSWEEYMRFCADIGYEIVDIVNDVNHLIMPRAVVSQPSLSSSSLETALKAYEMRPRRAESLYDLARHYREKGENVTSLLFSAPGLESKRPDDLLFVEDDAYDWGFREEFSICAFYSEQHRDRGRQVCDGLTLDRSVPAHARETARQNMHFYLQPIAEVFTSWRAHRLAFMPPSNYLPMAPSVTRYGNRLVAAQRVVNYKVDERGYVEIKDDRPLGENGKIHSRTFLLEIDPETLADSTRGEILLPERWPAPSYDVITGFEDMRLFEWCGALWGISAVLEQSPDARAEQWLARIGSDLRMSEARAIRPEGPVRPREKNWMPLVDGEALRFIYWSDPTRIINDRGDTVATSTPEIAADHLRGSSPAIPFDDGWLAVVHWVQWFGRWPKYRHRFAWYDSEFRLRSVSPGWVFPSDAMPELLRGYQYVTGLCWHPDGQRLVMGFQIEERQSWIGVMDADDVRNALAPKIEQNAGRVLGVAPTQPPDRVSLASGNDDGVPVELPLPTTWNEKNTLCWIKKETNRALTNQAKIGAAYHMVTDRGLPTPRDAGWEAQGVIPPKNWDNSIAVIQACKTTARHVPVLDAGGDEYAAFLPGLRKLGFQKCYSLNISEGRPRTEGGICFGRGDITATLYPDRYFGFIACLSVIEHGVDVQKFFKEAHRILKSGGHLFLSFDYWETPIDTGSRMAFGAPVKIFSFEEAMRMVVTARDLGFAIAGNDTVDLRCGEERPVSWVGLSFTFANLLFQKH